MAFLFQGSYKNETEPLWARAGQGGGGGGIGPDIQVSTVSVNGAGSGGIILDATGTVTTNFKSAPVVFQKTTDVPGGPSFVAMTPNVPNGGGPAVENISIVNDTRAYYDPLSVAELNVYGLTNTIQSPVGSVGVIGQYGGTTDMEIVTSGLHTSNLFVSSINGTEYPPGFLNPNPVLSTVTLNEDGGRVILNSKGTVSNLSSASIEFKYTPDVLTSYNPQMRMETNYLGGSLGPFVTENVSLVTGAFGGSNYYDTMSLGDLLLYGINNEITSTIGQVALFRQFSTTTDLECVTTGFNTSNLIVSTINGTPYGPGGGVGPNLLVSTIQVNPFGNINMTATGITANPSTSVILFQQAPGFGSIPSKLGMTQVNVKGLTGVVSPTQNLAVTQTSAFGNITTYDNFAVGNMFIYGLTNPITSTIGQLGVFETWSTTSTDIQLRTTGFHTSSMFASSIVCDSIIASQPIVVSTVATQSIDASLIKASTFSLFNNAVPVDLGGINLGLGEFLGNYVGAFAGQTLTMTLAGSAVGISLIGAIAPRLEGNITVPGQPSTFQTINLQTQLQYSTLGTATSTFTRYVSSTDGLMGTVTPGFEYIISSIIPPGTTCIRSFSDPINLANPSTFTSTVQSFGYWIPVPQQPAIPFSTVTGDFVVQSTLTANSANISTNLNAVGTITGGNVVSQGVVTAVTNMVAGGTVQAGGNLTVAGLANITGTLTAPFIANNTLNTVSINSLGINNNINILNTNYISTNYVYAGTLDTRLSLMSSMFGNDANVSSLTVSSINGLPYNPGGGGGGTLGIFSTLLVSSVTNTSSLNVIGTTNTSTINTNQLSTFSARANNVSATSMQFGATLTPTSLNSAGGIFNNNTGIITYPSGVISSINTNNISTSRINANTISTQSILVSTVNGLTYPPPFNSTIQGNLYVTSTMVARDVFATDSITALGNIGSSGNITGFIGTFTSIADAGALSVGGGANITGLTIVTGDIRVSGSGVIGGVGLGPVAGGRLNGDIYGRGAYVSTLTTNGNSIFNGNINVNSPNAIFTNQLQLQNGGIFGVSSINGVVYPPFIPSGSTFNQVFTSSMLTSTLTTLGVATTTGLVNLGNISTTSMNMPQIDIGVIAGQISSATMKSLSSDTINLTARVGNVSSLTVSTINNLPFPPFGGPNAVFSTIVVSSSALVGGFLTASGASIGGSQFTLGGLITTSTIATRTVQASVSVSAPQGNFANISSGTIDTAFLTNTTGPGPGDNGPITLINAPLVGANSGFPTNNDVNIVSSINVGANINVGAKIVFDDVPVPALSGIYGGASAELFFSTSIVSGNPQAYTQIFPNVIELVGSVDTTLLTSQQVTVGNINGFGNQVTSGVFYERLESVEYISTTATPLRRTQVFPGQILIGVSTFTDLALTTNGRVNIAGSLIAGSLTTSNVFTNQISSFNNTQVATTNQIGSQLNTGIQTRFGPNPAGVGIAQLITGTIYQSGQYQWGGSFLPNVPRTMPTVYFSCLFPCGVDVVIQSFSNDGGSNAQTMAASFKMFFGRQNATTLGGPYVDVVNTFTYYQNNCVMSVIPIAGTPSSYLLAPYTTINDGRPPSQVVISWKVQPAYVLGSS